VDCFVMMHVFEHFQDPFTILESIKKKLSSMGKIIMEVPYFSGYYHQHLFFYSLTFLRRLCSDKNLKIVGLDLDIAGETLRVVMTHLSNNRYEEKITDLERPGDILGLSSKKVADFGSKVTRIKSLLLNKRRVFWWGAGSSSVIYLSQIEKDILENTALTVIDGDKNKWGLYIPVINLKVIPFTVLKNRKIDYLIIASSFSDEICETLRINDIFAKRVEVFV
jgi:hypothetical protein